VTQQPHEILGYLAPVSQGKDVLLQLRVPAGIVAFRASQTLVTELAKNVLVIVGAGVKQTEFKKRKRIGRVRVHDLHEKVLDAWTHGSPGCKTQFAACVRYGDSYGAFSLWLFRKRKREAETLHGVIAK